MAENSTDFPERLTPEQRRHGQKMLRHFMRFNGVSIALLMENILILYAIRNGLTDPQVAILASFIHLTMPFMVLGKRLVSEIGSAKSWSINWAFRYASALIMVFAPFVDSSHQWGRVVLIMAGAFGFALFRSMGIVNNSPLQGDITTPQERGRFLSGNVFNAHTAYFISMAIIIMVLRLWDKISVYQIFIGIGCATGFVASYFLSKVPESTMPSESASKPLIISLTFIWNNPGMRRMLFGWCAGFVLFVMTLPFSVITIKNGYGIPDHIAMIFTLMIIGGGIVSALFNGFLADLVGPRPLIILYGLGFFIIDAFWAFAPPVFMPGLTLFVFFLGGFCKIGMLVGLGHYLLVLVDEMERVGISLVVRAASGATAGLAGSVVGATILKILQDMELPGMEVYRMYFRLIAVILVAMFILLYRLKRLKEWRLKHVFGLLFSFRDLQAIFVLNKLEKARSFDEDAENIEKLEVLGSSVSEEVVRDYIRSPEISVRSRALRALRQIDFGNATEKALKEELKRGEHTTAWHAAEILGEHGAKDATSDLRACLSSEDVLLRGKSMVALVRLDDRDSVPEIVRQFQESSNPRIVVYGSQALIELKDPAYISVLLEKVLEEELPEAVKDQVYMSLAVLCGVPKTFYSFLREYKHDRHEGIHYLFSLIEDSVAPPLREEARNEVENGKNASCRGRYHQLLVDLAENSSKPQADLIREFLCNHKDDGIPRKMEFFLTLALFDPKRHRDDGYLAYGVD